MILRPYPAARALLAVALAAFALAGCARSWTEPPAPRHMHELALISSLGEEAGLKLIAVDGQRLDAGTAGVQPLDAPVDFDPRMGLWLAPGAYVLGVQYVRNIEAGISLTQADLPVRLRAGRTYILRPQVSSDYAVASFTLADHGAAFPLRCLPWSLRQARPVDARGARAPHTRADLDSCRLSRLP